MQSRTSPAGRSQPPAARAGLTSRRIRIGVSLLVGVAAVSVAVAGIVGALAASAPRTRQAAATLTGSVDVRHPGAPVPREFLGLSFELSSLAQIASYADRGDLRSLLRSVGPGVLRFGGASADTRVAWTDERTPRPAWASAVLEASDLRKLRRLAEQSGWRVLLTVGLAHFDPQAAAREAAAAKAALGPWLAGIEVGNEPDAYARHGFRTLPWSYAQYDAQLRIYRRAITALAPGIPLAGPGVSGSSVFARWGPREAASQDPSLLTGHHYPLGCHDAQTPTIARLLSGRTRQLEDASLARYMAVSRASAIGLRLDEANTVSCGGRAGVSNTFASALWAVDYIAQAMTSGATGINLQGNPGNCRGYSPVCAPTPVRLSDGALSAQPEWFALLLSRALIGDRPLRVRTASQPGANLVTTALLAPDGSLRLVIVDGEPAGSRRATLRLRVGRGFHSGAVMALTAPALRAESGIELGELPRIAVKGGALALTVRPASAELVTLTSH
jgi:hypothetical protein